MKSCLEIIKAFPFLLDAVYNIKEWLSPHAEELHAHTQPKSFKFVRDEQGHCVMYYRNYSHMKWEGPQQLLKVHACYTVLLLKLMLIFKIIKKTLINSKSVETFHHISLLLPLGKLKFDIQGQVSNFNFHNKMSTKCSL